MKRTRKNHNAVIKAKGWWWRRFGGTGRSPSWRVSSAFIRTGSTTGRSSCWTGPVSVLEGRRWRTRMLGKRSLEKRCPSDGGPSLLIRLPSSGEMVWGRRRRRWHHRRWQITDGVSRMPQLNDLSRSLVALDQDSTIIAVVELSQSSWLVAGVLPGIERQPQK